LDAISSDNTRKQVESAEEMDCQLNTMARKTAARYQIGADLQAANIIICA